jgi:hypothetical protein
MHKLCLIKNPSYSRPSRNRQWLTQVEDKIKEVIWLPGGVEATLCT